jgi:hypothetical protein
VVTVMWLSILGGVAAAGPVKNGKILACYKVKGKPKGSLRVLFKGKKCKRGERRVAWTAADTVGPPGASGQTGESGHSAPASPGSESAILESKVAALTLKVESLEQALAGFEGLDEDLGGVLSKVQGLEGGLNGVQGDLSDVEGGLGNVEGGLGNVQATLAGVTNGELTKAVDVAPAVEPLCEQASDLTAGLNLLNTGIEGLEILGNPLLSLDMSSLPEPVGAFTCP